MTRRLVDVYERIGLMLYVDDVVAEKAFWQAAGFIIVSESQVTDFETFDMKNHAQHKRQRRLPSMIKHSSNKYGSYSQSSF
ncbi:hypothetical protein [Streptococcus hyovaginalis]